MFFAALENARQIKKIENLPLRIKLIIYSDREVVIEAA
jgi:hypothetical protein